MRLTEPLFGHAADDVVVLDEPLPALVEPCDLIRVGGEAMQIVAILDESRRRVQVIRGIELADGEPTL